MSTKTITKKNPNIGIEIKTVDPDKKWQTVIFNCYCHTFEDVARQIKRAILCTDEKANDITLVAELTGSAIVCFGTKEYCENIARMLGGTGLDVTVTQ
jgi:ATP-dependent Clp protease adapter protein ClpS